MRRNGLTAVLLAALAALPAARAADAGTPGSHNSRAAVAPAQTAGPFSFQCGGGYCDARTQYCETIKTDVPELPSDHGCMPLPKACKVWQKGAKSTKSSKAETGAQSKKSESAASCGCFAQGTRCDFCSVVEEPGGAPAFHRTCIGGY
jgi:hypothetical protein